MKKRKLKNHFFIEEKGLKINLNLFIGYKINELNTLLEKGGYKLLKDDGRSYMGTYFLTDREDGIDTHCIWVESYEWKLRNQCVLVHEICHFVRIAMERSGMNISDETANEVFAYLVEYFTYEASKIIDAKLSKKKNERKPNKKTGS